MERITYRITLDAHRNGIQRTLQGFETADNIARRIAVNLVSSGDTYEMPMGNVVAMMYVTTPSATEPSIHKCVIDGNSIVYDAEPIVEEGITEMQLKVIETSPEGAKKVLILPRFAVEVSKSNTDDNGATQKQTFTALEDAIAKADAIYNSRILRVIIEDDCIFKVYYADGTVYENDYFRNAMYNGNALLSQSYAVGGAGVRADEDTDNSKYYSNVSRSASEDATRMYEESHELLNESKLHVNYTHFQMNFETGELGYVSANTKFNLNKDTGCLETDRNEAYTPEDVILSNVDAFIDEKSAEMDDRLTEMENTIKDAENNNEEIELLNQRVEEAERLLRNVNTEVDNMSMELDDVNSAKQNRILYGKDIPGPDFGVDGDIYIKFLEE